MENASPTAHPKLAVQELGHGAIDGDHLEFVRLVTHLLGASSAEFPALFGRLVAHTEEHFARENELMRESNFPATGEHEGEHRRVLGQLYQFKERVDRGLISLGRALVTETLPDWLSLHVSTMDSALVAHLGRSTRGD